MMWTEGMLVTNVTDSMYGLHSVRALDRVRGGTAVQWVGRSRSLVSSLSVANAICHAS
jgi:hypothetical protein